MEEFISEEKPKKKIDTGLQVGLCAIFISVATLFVYIYQARIMQSQQHASVWPYVESSHSNVDGFYLQVQNKGIGPAIIKDAHIFLDSTEVDLNGLFDELIGKNRKNMPYQTSYVMGRVMAPSESFKIFNIVDPLYAHKMDSAFEVRNIRFEICFCSIYKECWTSKGLEVVESKCK
ncbi:MAG: hypothetical protein ACKVOQ_03545 [Cyclobacteriaceae bacterium]